MELLETHYHYKEEWQYQKIYVDLNTMNIVRRQNYRDKDGKIVDSEYIFYPNDEGYYYFWETYGIKTVIAYISKLKQNR